MYEAQDSKYPSRLRLYIMLASKVPRSTLIAEAIAMVIESIFIVHLASLKQHTSLVFLSFFSLTKSSFFLDF